jgi:uncharacterized repeat protein (TIGR01451 family)
VSVDNYSVASGVWVLQLAAPDSIPVGGVFALQYVVTATAIIANQDFSNLAQVTWSSLPAGTPGLRDYGPLTGTTTLHNRTVPGLDKEVTPLTATLGSAITYVIHLPTPPITATVVGAVVTDVLDSRLQLHTVSSPDNVAVVSAGSAFTVTYLDPIPAGVQRSITVTAVLSDPLLAQAGDVISNVAALTHSTGIAFSNPAVFTVTEPHVTLDKSVQTIRQPSGASDLVTYTLAFTNTGDWPAYDLIITDALPAGVTFGATQSLDISDPATATTSGAYPQWYVSQLNVGGHLTLTFNARVSAAISAAQTLTNLAWGSYDSLPGFSLGERTYTIPTSTAVITTGLPALSLVKSAVPSPVEAGGRLTYTLFVTNTGIVSATGVVITDLVPANTSYLACGPAPCAESGGVASWTLGVLDVNASRWVTMAVAVASPLLTGTQLINSAWVTSSEGLTDTVVLTTPVTSAHLLDIIKHVSALTVEAGDLLTYTMNWSISGDEPALGVTISDAVPDNTTFVAASLPFTGPAGGVITWPLGDRNPGASGSVSFTVRVSPTLHNGYQILNTALITDTQGLTHTDTVTTTPYTLVSLGNQVWYDVNDNGRLDAGEVGMPGVGVELYRDSDGDGGFTPDVDTYLSSTTTIAGGYYTFTNLVPTDYATETYLIVITSANFSGGGALVNYQNSDGAVGGNSDLNSQDHGAVSGSLGSGGFVASTAVWLTVGGEPIDDGDANPNSNLTLDFGFYRLSLGNQVWLDTNNNGVLDGGEAGIQGVVVDLYDSSGVTVLFTTTTNAAGFYTFTGILSGTYVVGIVPPANYTSSTDIPSSANPDTNVDSDDNGVNLTGGLIRSNPVTLTPGDAGGLGNNSVITATGSTANPTVDFGVYPILSLGNQVWYDVNDNGRLDANEVGVPGVDVELYRDSDGDGSFTPGVDTYLASTATTAGGYYTFTNLQPSIYPTQTCLIVITSANFSGGGALVNYQNSDGAVGGNSDLNSQDHGAVSGPLGTGGFVASSPVSLTVGGEPVNDGDTNPNSNLTIDFGFYRLSLGNQVWYDNNHNGRLDTAEAVASGIPVTLYDSSGATVLSTTATDAAGFYTFTGLISGTYVVAIAPPPTFTNTVVIATSANPNNNVDSDNNGVNLTSDGLIRGNPVTLTPGNSGALGNTVVNTATGSTANPTVDFGLYSLVSLGNQVWYDVNDNGQLDAGEVGVAGVVVRLYRDSNGNGVFNPGVDTYLSSTTTIAGGYYTFTNLQPSVYPTQTYLVVITSSNFSGGGALVNYQNSDGSVGGNSDLNSQDHGAVSGVLGSGGFVASTPISLTVGGEPIDDGDTNPSTNLTIDFGFYRLTLGNQVWLDTNNNGLIDTAEAGLAGLTVRLYNSAGTTVLSTTTTGSGGFYTFTNLISGTYVVAIVPLATYTSSTDIASSANPGTNVDSDDNGVNLTGGLIRSNPVTLTPGDAGALGNNSVITATGSTANPTVDFGLYTPPNIALQKVRASPSPVMLSDLVTFTIRLTNTGPTTLTLIPLTDSFDSASLAFASATPMPNITGTGQVQWNDVLASLGRPNLPPGQSVSLTVVMLAVGITPPGAPALNTATTTGVRDIYSQQPPDRTSTANVAIVPNIGLVKRVLGHTPFLLGDQISFTIQITNLSNVAVITVPLRDVYDPLYISYAWAVPAPSAAAPGQIDWANLGPLAPHAAVLVTVVFTAVGQTTGTVNMAYVLDAINNYGTPISVTTGVTIPTAVTLLYFRVDSVNGSQVNLAWATGMEVDNLGFLIYRATGNVGDPLTQAENVGFVSATSPGGGEYGYTDDVPSSGVWWYWLADVDTSGRQTVRASLHTGVAQTGDYPYHSYLPMVAK